MAIAISAETAIIDIVNRFLISLSAPSFSIYPLPKYSTNKQKTPAGLSIVTAMPPVSQTQ
jgi:hypothetical protein